MKVPRRIAAGSLIVGTVLVAPNTMSSAAFSDCTSNYVCLWGNDYYQWMLIEKYTGQSGTNLTGDAQNQTDSWGNRSTSNARAMDTYDGGDCWTLSAGSRDGNSHPGTATGSHALRPRGVAEAVTRLSQSLGARR